MFFQSSIPVQNAADNMVDTLFSLLPYTLALPLVCLAVMAIRSAVGTEIGKVIGHFLLVILAVVVSPLAIALAVVFGPFVGIYYLATMVPRRAARAAAVTRLLAKRGEFDSWLHEQILTARIDALDGIDGAEARAAQLEAAKLANAQATVALQGKAPDLGRPPGLGRPYSLRKNLDHVGQDVAIEETWTALKQLAA